MPNRDRTRHDIVRVPDVEASSKLKSCDSTPDVDVTQAVIHGSNVLPLRPALAPDFPIAGPASKSCFLGEK